MSMNKVAYKSVTKNGTSESLSSNLPPKGYGIRHLQTFLLFICLAIGLSMRSQLSVLLVAMVDTNPHDSNGSNIASKLNGTIVFNDNTKNISDWSVYRTYDWSKSTQEIITFSFFVGYTSMQLPMGMLAQKYGGKVLIMVALGVNGILSICMPWIALLGGWVGATASRFLQGITQAAYYPSMHTMLGKWAPASERGRLTTYAYSGSQLGTILAFQLSGLFAGSPSLGWPVSFWLFGVLSLIICGLLGYFGAATPLEHPSITAEELAYIVQDGNADGVPKKRKIPWLKILKCKAVWGQIITQSGSGAGYLLVLTEIPQYLNSVLGVDLKRNGLYSSLPYVAMYCMALLFGFLSDYIRNHKIMRVVNIRRGGNTIGMVGAGLFLVLFGFVNNTALAVITLVLSLGLHSGVHVGFVINQIDLAPNFAGSIMALGNMMGNLTSLVVPVIVTSIVTDVRNHRQWQIVFVIFAAILFISNAFFVVFATADVQPWNFYGEEKENTEKYFDLLEEKKICKEKE